MFSITEQIKKLSRRLGYDIRRVGMGQDPYRDIKEIIGANSSPVIFDVGANVGQTIDILRGLFHSPTIHSFEPGRLAFAQLKETHARTRGVHLNHLALGSKIGRQTFLENSYSEMSSFLPLGPEGWGRTSSKAEIDVSTVDEYCGRHSIPCIDLLKSDTQGFDLEVIKGAQKMLDGRLVRLLFLELTFSKLYEDMTRVDEIFRFITDQGFELVSFYKFYYLKGRAGWTDALFVQPQFQGHASQVAGRMNPAKRKQVA